MTGPFHREQDTEGTPVVVLAERARNSIPPNQTGTVVRDAVFKQLLKACYEHGAETGTFDERVLYWLAKWEPATAAVVIGLIERAHAAGRAAPAPFDLAAFTAETTTRVRWICDTDRHLHREPVGPAWCAVALVLGDDDWLTEHADGVDTAVGSVCQHTGMTPVQLGNWIGGIRDVVIKGGAS